MHIIKELAERLSVARVCARRFEDQEFPGVALAVGWEKLRHHATAV